MNQPTDIPKRFSRKDWTELGISALKTHGPAALTVEEMCEKARKTRGSFYFHFETVDDFLIAIATHWQTLYADEIVEQASGNSSRRDLLNHLVGRLDIELESRMRQLAQMHESVGAIVHDADIKRIAFLSNLYWNSGKFEKTDAGLLARIEYAAFVGFKLVEPEITATQSRELYDAFLKFTNRI